jgi:hypothetical protein
MQQFARRPRNHVSAFYCSALISISFAQRFRAVNLKRLSLGQGGLVYLGQTKARSLKPKEGIFARICPIRPL